MPTGHPTLYFFAGQLTKASTYGVVFPVIHLGRNKAQETVKGFCMIAQAILQPRWLASDLQCHLFVNAEGIGGAGNA